MSTANVSRRNFLKTGGALVVSFSSIGATGLWAQGPGPFDTHESNVDPKKLDSWIAVHSDGTVTAYTGKCDMGQGMLTVQTQLVAEELCVPLHKVNLVMCDTEKTPDQGTTSGSQSSPTNFNHANLALAAATAREALLGMAAARLNQPAGELTVADGVVQGKAGQHVSYAELIGDKQFNLPLSQTAKRRPQKDWTVLGKPVPALDRPALMTGTFEFVHYVQVPGMAHGRVVRPPMMGARVKHVDESSVRDVPGMVKVVVRKDFVGVVAETQYAAIQAAQKLKVDWIPGPDLPDQKTFFEEFLQKQPSRDALMVDSGDVDAELKKASKLVKARYTYPYQMHGSVGPSCAVADVKADSATIWSPTQSAYPTRKVISMLLGIPTLQVHVIFTRGSGCYGLNGADAVSFDAAVLSQGAGRPVRLQYSREDEMKWENFGAAMVIEQRAALRPDGSISVWDREDWAADRGSRPGYDRPGNVISGMLLGYDPEPLNPGPAKKPSGELRNGSNTVPPYFAGCIDGVCGGGGTVRSERALTHTVFSPFFTGPLRSPLRIQNTFANESFIDELAEAAQADPVAYRLQHLSDERIRGVLKAAAQAAGWQTKPFAKREWPRSGKVSGRGVACVGYEGHNGYAAGVADVEVDLETGEVHPRRFFCALDVGPISNPDGLRNQIEGGLLQGMSRTLGEEVTWDKTKVTSVDWSGYHSLYFSYEMPTVTSVLLNQENVPATGAGETAITLAPALIANAIFDATGVRIRSAPFTAERVKAALAERA
jgi:nicotinate dehydrogenase subunit B